MRGTLPALENLPRYDTDGFGGAHLYAPWWLWDGHDKLDFPRGYHIEMGGGFSMPGPGGFGREARAAGYGKELKRMVREQYGCGIGLSGRGEMIPNNQSYMDLDPTWSTAGASPCRVSTSPSATTNGSRRGTWSGRFGI